MKEHNSKLSRRNFLLTVGVGSAAAATAIVAKSPATQPGDKDKRATRGYQAASEHINNYYRTTKV